MNQYKIVKEIRTTPKTKVVKYLVLVKGPLLLSIISLPFGLSRWTKLKEVDTKESAINVMEKLKDFDKSDYDYEDVVGVKQ